MECFRIKLLHKNEFKNSLILYKVKKCIYIQNKSFVKKQKTKNKQGSGTTANEKSHCWSLDSPREQKFLKKRPEIPVLS